MSRGFAAMQTALVRDGSIPPNEKTVMLILLSYARQDQVCWPSHKTLAGHLGSSTDTVKRALVKLRERGLIEWTNRTREDGGATSCEYRILTSEDTRVPPPQCKPALPPPCEIAPPPHAAVHHQEEEAVEVEAFEEQTLKNTPSPRKRGGESEDDRRFEAFWVEYPRKIGKKAAVRAFAKAVKEGADPQKIIEGAIRYDLHTGPGEERYIKHPTTWLNHGCWDDVYETQPLPRRNHG